jgi:hypothetical protein
MIELNTNLILKSSDNEYMYNITRVDTDEIDVDILNNVGEFIASRTFERSFFQSQIESGTITELVEEDYDVFNK